MAKQNELVEQHLYIAKYLARRYSRTSAPFEDLYQEGCIGLIKAYRKFDPTLGFKFSTYATWWVKQAILSSLTSSSRTIRLPSHIVQLKLKLYKISESYITQNGCEPTEEYLALQLDISEEKVHSILGLQLEVDLEDFEAFITKEEDDTLIKLEKQEERELVISNLDNLTLKEKIVTGLQYGILSKIV